MQDSAPNLQREPVVHEDAADASSADAGFSEDLDGCEVDDSVDSRREGKFAGDKKAAHRAVQGMFNNQMKMSLQGNPPASSLQTNNNNYHKV